MDRKATAKQTLQILEQGWYEYEGKRVSLVEAQQRSLTGSILIPPQAKLTIPSFDPGKPSVTVEDCATVAAVLRLRREGVEKIAVLNFASAKNPGGGFLNGAMAQEESLAASSGLYPIQLAHPAYYEANRTCGTMTYTDYAIYAPEVVFFRDQRFALLSQPVTASVLTLPAVNMGQVLLKGEDSLQAKQHMQQRMRRALEIFAHQGDRVLILGAYGCGVFRNDPTEVAQWWQALLAEGFGGCFDRIVYAVLDNSKTQASITAFRSLAQ